MNWYPWGDEPFAVARRENKPVFLSIGYSTCHWCHVMEEESFEDLEIAQTLNERYVAIKIDREERPDVDAVYMTAVQALTGRGGWPMSVWLDADRRPFFTGTYFPKASFASVLQQLSEIYATDPARVAEAAGSITAAVQAAMAGAASGADLPGTSVLDMAAQFYGQRFDAVYGGMRGAPKFPSSLPVRLLLREHRRTEDAAALAMAEHTLAMMAAGGMHDQLAGGFHRYSTDERWLVPHFEKMLYDNALLAVAYAEAWQVTGRRDFARVLRTTLDYVLREMTAPGGGFYSATDADSEGEEGTFFVWSADEIRRRLGTRRALRFMEFYGVTAQGNFEGHNVLFVPAPDEGAWEALAAEREILRLAREDRPHPLRDEKILTAWNGLMISALATGGRVLDEPRYVDAAAGAAEFVLAELRIDGRLQRSWKDGRTSGAGFLEDDAFFVAALLDLYEATFDPRWLATAQRLAERSEPLFGDAEHGGWFRSAADHEHLLAREKPHYDGAEPAGGSVALLNALRLGLLTGDGRWQACAERALRAYATPLREQPAALHEMLLALDFFTGRAREIVLVWPPGSGPPATLVDSLRRTFVPNRVLLGAAAGDDLGALAELAPIVAGKTTLADRPAAYVCEQGACRLPTSDPDEMLAQLG